MDPIFYRIVQVNEVVIGDLDHPPLGNYGWIIGPISCTYSSTLPKKS
jgi:hypothetical protein